jgi:hypothetical protein
MSKSSATLLLVTLFLVSLSCHPQQGSLPSQNKAPASTGTYDVIFAQCFAPQGNGGNWAATLAWVSETINLRILEADHERKNGKRVGLYLGCMTGGSSGSVVTATLSAILSNKSLLPGKTSQSVLTIDEARVVSRAVRFVAQSADYNLRELVRFFGHAALRQADKTFREKAAEIFGAEAPKWWDGGLGTVSPKMMLVDFATSLHLAATMNRELLDRTISSALKDRELQVYRNRGVTMAADLPQFAGLPDVPRASTDEGGDFASAFSKQGAFLQRAADDFVSKQFAFGEYASRHARDLGPRGGDYKLKRTLDAPMADGFCSITMASLQSLKQETVAQPEYGTLSPVVFCSESTIKVLLASDVYRSYVKAKNPYVSRFVLAVVPSTRGAIVPSIREPELMDRLISPLSGGELEVTTFYSPEWDHKQNGQHTFQLMSAAPNNADGQDGVVGLAVAGGFPDRRIAAWIPSLFLIEAFESKLKPLAPDVRMSFALFGRNNVRSFQEFHKNAVRSVFSAPDKAESNLKDWLAFSDAWCDTMASRITAVPKSRVDNVTLDWEVSRLPAAQQPGGASNLLVVKSINATRTQAGRHLPMLGVVFDPEVDSSHVPNLTQPHGCKEI